MDKEKIELYAAKYKKHQTILSYIVAIVIILFGIALFAGGGFLAYYKESGFVLALAIIMIILGMADIWMSVRFIKFEKDKLQKMSSKEAATRYSRITGNK